MMLLTTRLRIDANGQPHIPGSLDVWKNLFVNHPQGKYDGKLTSPPLSGRIRTMSSKRSSVFAQGGRKRTSQDLHGNERCRSLSAHAPGSATVDRLARDLQGIGRAVQPVQRRSRGHRHAINQFIDVAAGHRSIKDLTRAEAGFGRHYAGASRSLADLHAARDAFRRASPTRR